MSLKRFTLCFILVFILSAMIFEVVLCTQRDLPPLELDAPQFEYQYVDIYKRFFRRVRLSNGTIVYKAQCPQAQAQPFPAYKIKGTKRIFVLGGSVAMPIGDRDGSGIYIKELLENLIPEEKFEVFGCGMGTYDSYIISNC